MNLTSYILRYFFLQPNAADVGILSFLLFETGNRILMEDASGKLALEITSGPPSGLKYIQLESSMYHVLLEDSSGSVIMENS